MRLTIIPDDQAVYVGGIAIWPLDMTGIDPTIHAVQWYGEATPPYGEIEFKADADGNRQPNQRISNMSQFAPFVDRYNSAKANVPSSR